MRGRSSTLDIDSKPRGLKFVHKKTPSKVWSVYTAVGNTLTVKTDRLDYYPDSLTTPEIARAKLQTLGTVRIIRGKEKS